MESSNAHNDHYRSRLCHTGHPFKGIPVQTTPEEQNTMVTIGWREAEHPDSDDNLSDTGAIVDVGTTFEDFTCRADPSSNRFQRVFDEIHYGHFFQI